MRISWIVHLTVGAVILWSGTGAVSGAKEPSQSPIAETLEEKQRILKQLKQEIDEKRHATEGLTVEEQSLLQLVEDLDRRLVRLHREHDTINKALKKKDQQLYRIDQEISELRTRLRDQRSAVLARLRRLYMEGRFGYVKALLGSTNQIQVQRRMDYLSAISQKEYDLIERYRADRERLEHVKGQRAGAREDLRTDKDAIEQNLLEIQEIKGEKRLLLANVSRRKAAEQLALEELEQSKRDVDGRIQKLLKQLEQRQAESRIRPQRHSQGSLPWPADGEVISFFGHQKHPTFDTYVQRKGIEIRTKEGSAIRAVSAGTVAYADWLKGYGLVLILDHGNGFFSLYAHASTLMVEEGDTVKIGQVVGETGQTGMAGENVLYFELRKGTEPVDPIVWLARRP